MLANNLTLDDEEAVQDELLALQQNIVRIAHDVRDNHSLFLQALEEAHALELPDAPVEQPASSITGKTEIYIAGFKNLFSQFSRSRANETDSGNRQGSCCRLNSLPSTHIYCIQMYSLLPSFEVSETNFPFFLAVVSRLDSSI